MVRLTITSIAIATSMIAVSVMAAPHNLPPRHHDNDGYGYSDGHSKGNHGEEIDYAVIGTVRHPDGSIHKRDEDILLLEPVNGNQGLVLSNGQLTKAHYYNDVNVDQTKIQDLVHSWPVSDGKKLSDGKPLIIAAQQDDITKRDIGEADLVKQHNVPDHSDKQKFDANESDENGDKEKFDPDESEDPDDEYTKRDKVLMKFDEDENEPNENEPNEDERQNLHDEYTKRDDHILIPVNVAPDGTMSKPNQDYNAYFVYDADLDNVLQ